MLLLSCKYNSKTKKDPSISISKSKSGNIIKIGAIINGKKEGLWTEFDEHGKLSSQYIYLHDSIFGESINYFDDGETISSRGMLHNGKQEGKWKYFYSENKIARMGSFKNGEKVGIWVSYSLDGVLYRKIAFKNGRSKVIYDIYAKFFNPRPPDSMDAKNQAYIDSFH